MGLAGLAIIAIGEGTRQIFAFHALDDRINELAHALDRGLIAERGDKAADVGNNTLVIKGKGNYTGEARATWSLVAKDVTVAVTQ